MNRERVGALLRDFAGKRILVIGDLMLDEFLWGKVSRISPEANTLDELWADHGRYLLARLQVHADAARLSGTVASVQRASGNFVEYQLRYVLPQVPDELRLQQDLLNEIEYAPGNPWEASYIVNVRGNTDEHEAIRLGIHQVMMLLAPFMRDAERLHLNTLSQAYLQA